jgi:hypothetical protein
VEWSVAVETEVFVESLGLWSIIFVEIDNLPSLVGSTMFLPDDNCLSFNIFSSTNIKEETTLLS